MGENTYQLYITSKISHNQDKDLIVQRLAALFRVTEKRADQLLSKPKTILKENLDKETAEKYQRAISKTGAECKIIDTSKRNDSEKNLAHTKLEELDYSVKKYTCPKCGADKDFYTDICSKCGADQFGNKVKGKSTFKRAIKYITVVVIICIILFTVNHFSSFLSDIYNKYANKLKINNGFSLAFDTRDKVTEFILRTNFWPNQNLDADLDKNISNDIIKSIIVSDNAVMTVTIRARALNTSQDKTVIFKPRLVKGKILWNCTTGTLDNDLRPSICQKNIQ